MNALLRVSLCAGAMATAFIVLEFARPGWFQSLEPELPRLSESSSRMVADDESAEQLEMQRQMVLARLQLKRQIVEDLCAEKLSLLEAAARFRDLDKILPDRFPSHFARYFPCGSDEECYCLRVIMATQAQLASLNKPYAALIVRLRAELEQKLATGNLQLPERKW
jgi:hypothetical protein